MARRYYVLAVLLTAAGVVGLWAPASVSDVLTVTPVHSAFHLASGACAGFAATRGLGTMRLWGKILGTAYLALAIAGFVMDSGTLAWLHLGIAALFLYHALLAPPTL
jgi:hypothetical protein